MLLRLARQDPQLHPDDPERRAAIYHKYKVRVSLSPRLLVSVAAAPRPHQALCLSDQDFSIPEAEAEWVGLTLEEAVEKQRLLEEKVSPGFCIPTWRGMVCFLPTRSSSATGPSAGRVGSLGLCVLGAQHPPRIFLLCSLTVWSP